MSLMTAPPLPPQAPTQELVDSATLAHRAKMSKRRKLMFWISLPFVLLILALAVKLCSLSLFTSLSITSYEERDYATAVDRLSPLDTLNRFESYKVHFNRGTAQLVDRKFESSEGSLKKALDLAPDEVVCDVRRNLAFVYSGQADDAVKKGNLLGSIRLFQKSIQALDVPECAEDEATQQQKSDTEDKQDQSEDQQEQKEQEQNGGQEPGSEQPGGEGEEPGSGGEPGGQEPGTGQEPGGGEPGTGQEPGGGEPGGGEELGGEQPGAGGEQPGAGDAGGGDKKDQLNDRNNQARQDRDKERQKSNTGKGPRRSW